MIQLVDQSVQDFSNLFSFIFFIPVKYMYMYIPIAIKYHTIAFSAYLIHPDPQTSTTNYTGMQMCWKGLF